VLRPKLIFFQAALAGLLSSLAPPPAFAESIVVDGRTVEIPVAEGFCALDASAMQALFVDMRVPRSPALQVAHIDCAELDAMRRGVAAAVVRMITIAVPRAYYDHIAPRGYDWVRDFAVQADQSDEFLKLLQPYLVARSVANYRISMRDERIVLAPGSGVNHAAVAQVSYNYQIGRFAAREDVRVAAMVVNGVPLLVSSLTPDGAADGEQGAAQSFTAYLDALARANPDPAVAHRSRMRAALAGFAAISVGGLAFALRGGTSS
jgi:hypothetical protein